MTRLIIVFTVIISLFWSLWQPYPRDEAVIIICDVGQGDAIILIHGTNQILIDGGPTPEKVLKCLGENLPIWDKKIEMVVATHAHADHIGGLIEVIGRYKIGTILANHSIEDSDIAKQFFLQISNLEKNGEARWVQSHPFQVFKLDHDFWLQIWSTPEENKNYSLRKSQSPETILSAQNAMENVSKTSGKNDENNRSIALNIQFKSFSILLTGDLECPGEVAMIRSGVTRKVNMLKVGHHGSKTSTCQGLLEEIQPENVVISVGENNRFQHPSPDVLSNLVAFGAKIWRTDVQGRIKIISDGYNYWIEPGENQPSAHKNL